MKISTLVSVSALLAVGNPFLPQSAAVQADPSRVHSPEEVAMRCAGWSEEVVERLSGQLAPDPLVPRFYRRDYVAATEVTAWRVVGGACSPAPIPEMVIKRGSAQYGSHPGSLHVHEIIAIEGVRDTFVAARYLAPCIGGSVEDRQYLCPE